MKNNMDYTSPNQDHSSSKLSSPTGDKTTTRDHHHHHQHRQSTNTNSTASTTQALGAPNHPDPIPATRYRECLKNHAASAGGHVLDGCGEFMPSNTDTESPESLKCAACDCHRNFHRKETEGQTPHHYYNPNNIPTVNAIRESQPATTLLLPHYHQHHNHNHNQPVMMMAFGGAESSSEDLNAMDRRDQSGRLLLPVSSPAKKRFRTKFKEGQKEKMTEFAERLGWRIQKHDEQEVQRFCSEIGVKRQVFKVWMHNNKQAMKKKDGSNSDHHHQPDVTMPIT